MIKIYKVSRKYIMLFMHNNRILTFIRFTYLLCTARKKHHEIFEIFQKYFMKYLSPKHFTKFYITN